MTRNCYDNYEYRNERRLHMNTNAELHSYKSRYLGLRKQLREWVRANNVPAPQEIKDAIGMKK